MTRSVSASSTRRHEPGLSNAALLASYQVAVKRKARFVA